MDTCNSSIKIGKKLEELRKNKNITRTQLAKELNTKPHIIRSVEHGLSPRNHLELLSKLATYFGVEASRLIDDTTSTKPAALIMAKEIKSIAEKLISNLT